MTALVLALGVAVAEPTLPQVLERAAVYVQSFARQLSALAGEETYIQEVRGFEKRGCPAGTFAATYQSTMNCSASLVNPMRTELHSHLLLVRSGRSRYVQYRDVYEVDGKAVGDRAERFTGLFHDSSATAEEQRQRIMDESARYNIGDIARTMNVPLVALEFLSSGRQWRFSFKRSKDATARIGDSGETPPGTFRVATDVWVLEYQERESPTVIRTTEGRDVKSHGRIWVEADTGRILMTELLLHQRDVDVAVNVSFKSEPLLGMLVPVEMRERYRGRKGSIIDAVATYGRFAPFKLE
jgi:hypothetical protein